MIADGWLKASRPQFLYMYKKKVGLISLSPKVLKFFYVIRRFGDDWYSETPRAGNALEVV